MPAWTNITNALVAVGAKPFATTIQALRDNPIAIAEGQPGAPVPSTGWHPYNMVNVGDGATGRFYDFATNGATGSIVSPTFEAGYDYWLRWVNLSVNTVSGNPTLRINGTPISAIAAAADNFTGDIMVEMPTLTGFQKRGFLVNRIAAATQAITALTSGASTPAFGFFNFSNLATALNGITIDWSTSPTGQFDNGQVFLYRRRNFVTG